MGRKCSHCGNIGHNSRTCTNYKMSNSTNVVNGIRLFGVQVQLDLYASSCSSTCSSSIAMKKSYSMDCLPCSSPASTSPPFSSPRMSISEDSEKIVIGYLSDGILDHPEEKKKGVPWSEEEHKAFLVGLEKLGKGDWRGISRNFVTTRTPTQVASHAQKYFLRQVALNCKKRRSSLFDMVSNGNMGDRRVNSSSTKLKSSYLEENNENQEFSEFPSRNQVVHTGIFGPISSPNMNPSPAIPTPPREAPDLELTLGANPLLIGPIIVV